MTKDPVCGMQVDERNAPANSIYEGAYYAFCCDRCKDEFDSDPERYNGSQVGAEREPQQTV
ncbi:MAG TPA: YHS domain-containing protein [Bryobacteraceae bacterium]|nr:YHS domain-containing protein [Bryobacteraceae bacterium]